MGESSFGIIRKILSVFYYMYGVDNLNFMLLFCCGAFYFLVPVVDDEIDDNQKHGAYAEPWELLPCVAAVAHKIVMQEDRALCEIYEYAEVTEHIQKAAANGQGGYEIHKRREHDTADHVYLPNCEAGEVDKEYKCRGGNREAYGIYKQGKLLGCRALFKINLRDLRGQYTESDHSGAAEKDIERLYFKTEERKAHKDNDTAYYIENQSTLNASEEQVI